MPFRTIQLAPGCNIQQTATQNKTNFVSALLCRFYNGLVQKFGGWTQLTGQQIQGGFARALHAWADINGDFLLAIGTESRLLVWLQNIHTIEDITPVFATSVSSVTFTTTIGLSTVVLTDSGYSPNTGDWINVPTVVNVGGDAISGIHQVTRLTGTTYSIIIQPATSSASAFGTVQYLLPMGLVPEPKWSLDNFGQDLVAAPTNGMIYYWPAITITPAIPVGSASGTASFSTNVMDVLTVTSGTFDINQTITAAGVASGTTITSLGTGTGGVGTYNLSTTPGSISSEAVTAASSAPLHSMMIFVMPQVQILISVGSETGGIQEPLLIRWSDQGDFNDWTPTATNQAGSYFLPAGSYLVTGMSVAQGALLWTDADLWSMTYLGFPLVFGFNRIATRCGAISQNCVGIIGTLVMWLSTHGFFTITAGGGTASPMECSVWDFFYNNHDPTQLADLFCAPIPTFNEFVWFFYISPSSPIYSAQAPIAYVKFNIVENAWDYGQSAQFQRTAWVGDTPPGIPLSADTSFLLQQQETGTDANGVAMVGGWQTGYFDLAEGEDYPFIDLIIPDFTLTSTAAPPIISMNLLATNYPLPSTTPLTVGPFTINTAPGGTQFIPCRVRARQIALSASWGDLGTFNRIGAIRYRFSPDGRA
jgi:hypothetical protein